MGAVGNTFESNRGLEEEGMCREVAVVRIEFGIADEGTAGLILELDDDIVGRLILCSGGDDAGVDSGARPSGNSNPNTASWESMFVVSHCCRFSFSLRISFVSSTVLTPSSSLSRNGG